MLRPLVIAVLLAAVCVAASPASANVTSPIVSPMTYGFSRITYSAVEDITDQLTVDVTNEGPGQVSFKFWNLGHIASSITDIYFDEGTILSPLASFSSLAGGPGVNFTSPACPGNLPGGKEVGFLTTAKLSADSDSPVPKNGINPGESLTITFALANGQSFTNVITDLRNGLASPPVSPWLRIGLHVQSIGAKGVSDSYVDSYELVPYAVNVPVPGALVLGVLGLGLVGSARRRLP